MDYFTELFKYRTAGIREYWIVDPIIQRVTVYFLKIDMRSIWRQNQVLFIIQKIIKKEKMIMRTSKQIDTAIKTMCDKYGLLVHSNSKKAGNLYSLYFSKNIRNRLF